MKVTNQPTKMTTLKTFSDGKGNQYELRGQQNMYSPGFCLKTHYYELYKKDSRSYYFEKVGAKEEAYLDSYYGYQPAIIKKEKIDNRKVIEETKISKMINGYDIEHKSDSLSMKGMLRVLFAKDKSGSFETKVKLPDALNINGQKPLSNTAKHIMKLLQYVKK